MTPTERSILNALSNGPMTAYALAELLGVQRAFLAKRLTSLKRRKLITLDQSRASYWWHLTPTTKSGVSTR